MFWSIPWVILREKISFVAPSCIITIDNGLLKHVFMVDKCLWFTFQVGNVLGRFHNYPIQIHGDTIARLSSNLASVDPCVLLAPYRRWWIDDERERERGATGRAGVWGRHVKRAGVSPRFYLIRLQCFLAKMTRDRHKIPI